MVNERSERTAHSSFMFKACKSQKENHAMCAQRKLLGGHFEKTGTHCVCRISGIAADPADEL